MQPQCSWDDRVEVHLGVGVMDGCVQWGAPFVVASIQGDLPRQQLFHHLMKSQPTLSEVTANVGNMCRRTLALSCFFACPLWPLCVRGVVCGDLHVTTSAREVQRRFGGVVVDHSP